MTTDETREQKALLLLEYQEAEAELANVEEKAIRIAERILAVGHWLRGFASDRAADDVSTTTTIRVSETATKINVKDQKVIESMNYQAAIALMQEMWQIRVRLEGLKKRKQTLGLK
jgi:hypothetical protein